MFCGAILINRILNFKGQFTLHIYGKYIRATVKIYVNNYVYFHTWLCKI